MPLKLTIVSEQREPLGARASIVMGGAGGSIGRARDNAWVLADPHCYLSAHHARVQFRLGTYYLHDTSTNGVFVNGGKVALGRRNIYPLRDGDSLRLGQYQISVRIEADPDNAPEASSIFPVGRAVDSSAYQDDIGAAIDVQDLLRTVTPGATGNVRPVDGSGQRALTEDTGLLVFDQGSRSAPTDSADAARTRAELQAFAEQRRTALATSAQATTYATSARAATAQATTYATTAHATTAQVTSAHAHSPSDTERGALEAFCRGAGIDSQKLSPESLARLLHRAGLLLREALVGIKGLALAQRELREQAQIKLEREPQDAGLIGLSVEDLLLWLLSGRDQHSSDTLRWLRDTASSNHQHDLATMRALHIALGEFIARLDPRALSQSVAERTASDAGAGSSGLTARFRSITAMSSGALPQLFAEAFVRAFTAEYKRARGHAQSEP